VLPILPQPLGAVLVDPAISPSAVSRSQKCRLQVHGRQLDKQRFPTLLDHPAQTVGTLVHRAIELADGCSNIFDVFDQLVELVHKSNALDPRLAHINDLKGSVSADLWASRVTLLRSRSGVRHFDGQVTLRGIAQVAPSSSDGSRAFAPGTHYEYWLRSVVHGISGVVDHLEMLADGSIRIVDWKTGRVTDDSGRIFDSYRLQMTAYRMVAEELWPGRQVSTWLYDGVMNEIKGEAADTAQVLEACHAVTQLKSPQMAFELASVGGHCFSCQLRLVCPAYRRLGPDGIWNSVDAERPPHSIDLAGSVESVVRAAGDVVVKLNSSRNKTTSQIRFSGFRFEPDAWLGKEIQVFNAVAILPRNAHPGKFGYPRVGRDERRGRDLGTNVQFEVFEVG